MTLSSILSGDNTRPDIEQFSLDISTAPQVVLDLTVQDAQGDAITCTVDWGDNSENTVVNNCYNDLLAHTYGQSGQYRITLRAGDATGESLFQEKVDLFFLAGDPSTSVVDLSNFQIETTIHSDRMVQLNGSVTNVTTLTIDWGDGSTQTLDEGLDAINQFHTYAENGSYPISLTGDAATEGVSLNIHVQENYPPQITVKSGTYLEFNTLHLSFAVIDPDQEAFNCQIDWGDGSTVETLSKCAYIERSHRNRSPPPFFLQPHHHQ